MSVERPFYSLDFGFFSLSGTRGCRCGTRCFTQIFWRLVSGVGVGWSSWHKRGTAKSAAVFGSMMETTHK